MNHAKMRAAGTVEMSNVVPLVLRTAFLANASLLCMASIWSPHSFANGEGPSNCQKRLIRVLDRISSEEHTVQLGTPTQSEVSRDEFHLFGQSDASVKIGSHENPVSIRVGSHSEMADLFTQTHGKGVWILQNPSAPDQRMASSHHSIVINNTWFNRLSDDLGENAMKSLTVEEASGYLTQSSYVMGQFVELSEESTTILHKFFHDRVWHYHAKTPDWISTYKRNPESQQVLNERCENCSFFSWSFLMKDWIRVAPDLAKVEQELGEVTVTSIPSQQFHRNSHVSTHRQNFIWGTDRESLLQSLRDGSFQSDAEGHQSLIHSFEETQH